MKDIEDKIKKEIQKVSEQTLDWIYYAVGLFKDEIMNENDLKIHYLIRALYNKKEDLRKANTQLKQQIESMKCCGNCKYEIHGYDGENECSKESRCSIPWIEKEGKTDLWELDD